jgi:hypothetical protein
MDGGAVVDAPPQRLSPELRELRSVAGVEADRQYRDGHDGLFAWW